MVGEQSCRP